MRMIRNKFNKLSPEKRRANNILFVILVAFISAYILLKHVVPYVMENEGYALRSAQEVIASVGVIVTIVIATINLITANMNKRYSSKKQLSLSVEVKGNRAIITSGIENKGSDRITPKSFYLFLNEGIETCKNGYKEYEFPNILKHECGEYDCALAKKCKNTRINQIPSELLGDKFKNKLSICKLLEHIAADSVNFIDPGEVFAEDVIFELPAGVYRVILVGVSVETDCMCAHKIFIIEEGHNNENNGDSRQH